MNDLFIALENLDFNLFMIINGMHYSWLDNVMWWLSNRFIWIPFYLLLLFFCYRTYGWKGALIALGTAAVAVGIVDSVTTYLVKEQVARFRPTHNVEFGHMVHTVNDYRGGMYGFFSGHAANTMAIAILFGRLLKQRYSAILVLLVIWSLLIGYSRIYLGVHYPADVVCGAIFGGLVGYGLSLLFKRYVKPIEG